ncbi:hypothetical protein LINGRAHAP2_LOCUS11468 [Linum grandiflorum]
MCPLLEDLRVFYFDRWCVPELVAPRLKVFVFEGWLDKIVFKCTPLLAVVSIQLTNESFIKAKEGPDMVALFASLPALQQLYVNSYFMKTGGEERVIPKEPLLVDLGSEEYLKAEEDSELNCFEEVHIDECRGSQREMLVLRFVLETAQRLQRVVIQPSLRLSRAESFKLVKEVSQFKLTSRQAEVVYR